MRFRWLLPSVLGIVGSLVLMVPVEAAQLESWRFDANENRLVFTTDGTVQPRAQLIFDPVRLVIDLPGTTLGRSMVNQRVGGAIREVRVGQFDAQTTRIVIELSPGYTLDPEQVIVQGATATQWIVQIPTPQRSDDSPALTDSTTTTPPALGATTQVENVVVTADGLFLRTSGAPPQLEIDRSRDRRQVTIALENTALSPALTDLDQALNRHGIERITLTQAETSPPVAQITLELSDPAEWQATVSNLGGIVLIPTDGARAVATNPDDPEVREEREEREDREQREDREAEEVAETAPNQSAQNPLTIIESVDLSSGDALLIRSQGEIDYETGWDRATGAYRITIPSARLADQVRGPELQANSPLLSVRLRQEDDETVVILIQPAAGVRIGDLNQPSDQLLALELERTSQQIPVTPPTSTSQPALPSGQLPSVGDTRVVVIVDPGHGGPDPGAIGIDGLREKDIVLPVALRVAELLEQQGVHAILTRSQDVDLDLEPRVQIAERADADLFVSIHANAISLSRPDVNGTETYYYSDSGLRFGQVIHASMVQVPGVRDRGMHQARFYVLRNTSMPAVLLELGFVTGAQDAELLSDSTFREQMATAIARGILQYIQQNF